MSFREDEQYGAMGGLKIDSEIDSVEYKIICVLQGKSFQGIIRFYLDNLSLKFMLSNTFLEKTCDSGIANGFY